MLINRVNQLYHGKEVLYESKLLTQANTLKTDIKNKVSFVFSHLIQFALAMIVKGVPILFAMYLLYFVFYQGTIDFFSVDAIEELGIYQLFTTAVISQQYSTNGILISKQSSYNQESLPLLSAQMTLNIEDSESTLYTFNSDMYAAVLEYNVEKCNIQRNIASYVDTWQCLRKYSETIDDPTKFCDGCDEDFKAMCLSGSGVIAKPMTGNGIPVSESSMPEKRRYCEFYNAEQGLSRNSRIDYQTKTVQEELSDDSDTDDAYDASLRANSTWISANWDESLTLKCDDGMIINTIVFVGNEDYPIKSGTNLNDWVGINEKYPICYPNTNSLKHDFDDANAQCEETFLDLSNLMRIDTEASNDEIKEILSIEGESKSEQFWIGLNDLSNEGTYRWITSPDEGIDFDTIDQFMYDRYFENLFGIHVTISLKKIKLGFLGDLKISETLLRCSDSLGFSLGKYLGKTYTKNFETVEKAAEWVDDLDVGTSYGDKCKKDGIVLTRNGWYDQDYRDSKKYLCENPLVQFVSEDEGSSFMHSIDKIECVMADRAPYENCQLFPYTGMYIRDIIFLQAIFSK